MGGTLSCPQIKMKITINTITINFNYFHILNIMYFLCYINFNLLMTRIYLGKGYICIIITYLLVITNMIFGFTYVIKYYILG